jgi:hypothetical protein
MWVSGHPYSPAGGPCLSPLRPALSSNVSSLHKSRIPQVFGNVEISSSAIFLLEPSRGAPALNRNPASDTSIFKPTDFHDFHAAARRFACTSHFVLNALSIDRMRAITPYAKGSSNNWPLLCWYGTEKKCTCPTAVLKQPKTKLRCAPISSGSRKANR